MELQTNLNKILKKGTLSNELEFQRASVIDRKLRLLVKEYPELADDRKKLRDILKAFEDQHWVKSIPTDQQVQQSDLAVQIAELEHLFNLKRKKVIKGRLKEIGLTQKDLGMILGHTSETYMSELINGINAFTINDLILIHKLLNINLSDLVPTTLNLNTIDRVISVVSKLNNPKLQIKQSDLVTP